MWVAALWHLVKPDKIISLFVQNARLALIEQAKFILFCIKDLAKFILVFPLPCVKISGLRNPSFIVSLVLFHGPKILNNAHSDSMFIFFEFQMVSA